MDTVVVFVAAVVGVVGTIVVAVDAAALALAVLVAVVVVAVLVVVVAELGNSKRDENEERENENDSEGRGTTGSGVEGGGEDAPPPSSPFLLIFPLMSPDDEPVLSVTMASFSLYFSRFFGDSLLPPEFSRDPVEREMSRMMLGR